MLDQNTDRMWFVIGAVIVGAAIIFIANGTLPEIFASVTDSFENVSNSAISEIDAQSRNLIDYSEVDYKHYVNIPVPHGGYNPNRQHGLLNPYSIHDTTGYIGVDSSESYIFYSTHNNGVFYVRMAYYDQNKNYLSGAHYVADDFYESRVGGAIGGRYAEEYISLDVPNDAKFVRISADNQHSRTGPIQKWRLITVDSEERIGD